MSSKENETINHEKNLTYLQLFVMLFENSRDGVPRINAKKLMTPVV